jgi:hypothetical protein
MDEITDNQLVQEYDRYTTHYNKLTNELKMVIVSDDKTKRKMLQKKTQLIHSILQLILKLRSCISDEKNTDV